MFISACAGISIAGFSIWVYKLTDLSLLGIAVAVFGLLMFGMGGYFTFGKLGVSLVAKPHLAQAQAESGRGESE